MKRERIKKYKSKKMSAMILAALLMGTVVQAEPVNNGDTKVHYFSVKSEETGEKSNFDSNGAKGDESMVIGIGSTSEGNNSTVIGNNNKLTGNKEIKKDDKVVSLNNSIVAGQNLEVDGYSNTVFATESIDDMRFQRQTKVAGDHNTVIGAGNLVGYKEGKTRQTYTKLGNGISSNKNVVIGSQLTVSGSDNVVLGYLTEFELGEDEVTTADSVTAIGTGNRIGSEAREGVAIGSDLGINGHQTVAIGFASEATAKSAISIGQFNTAEGENAISIGNESHAYAKNSIAIGGPVTEGPPGTGKPGASATAEGGVALGAVSVADREAGAPGYLSEGKKSAEWKSTLGALSIGAKFGEIEDTRQITGVAAGTEDTDAVNVAQLKKVASIADERITVLDGKVGTLDTRLNRAAAGAAALAALHPLDFDPEDKWDIAAGIGNYKNATAAAVGLFYRPNERTMLNLGWTMGDNRNMVNGGFSIKLGSGADISTSKTVMAREIRTLKDVVSQQNEQIERQNRKIEKQEREMKEVLEILAEMRKDKK